MKKHFTLVRAALLAMLSAFWLGSTAAEITKGIWRATLKTRSGIDIPFNFEAGESASKMHITVINGSERFKVNEVTATADSVFIRMPLFDSEIRAKLGNGTMQGLWIRHFPERISTMEFHAEANTPWRFVKPESSTAFAIGGRWSAVFGKPGSPEYTVGEFKQSGNRLTGTFLTTTGDYRFLEGNVDGNQLMLSCFDGSHAFLFTGTITDNNTITNGKFYAGFISVDEWSAKRDPGAKLPDAYSLTALKPGYKKIDFTFPDLDGNKISLSDAAYRGKVAVIQFMGSWCPNCMDETAFLAPFYSKYRAKGVEVIGLAYERSTDFERSKASVQRVKDRFNVTYPLLITGYISSKDEVAKSLPMLDKFLAFPTTIVIDKKGEVRKIHTGFSGPGTGEHYTQFTQEFEELINDLLAEK